MSLPSICFVGMGNLPVLAREYGSHGIGGESVQHTLLARAFQRRGHRVSMVVQDYGQEDGATWDSITVFKAYRANAGVPVLRFVHPRWTGLVAALQRARPDVVYVSCGGAPLGQIAFHARRERWRLVFRIAHDGDCLKDDRERIRLWRDRRLYEFGLRRADSILAQTTFQQQELRRNFGLESVVAGMLVQGPSRMLGHAERDVPALWVNNIRQFKRPDLALDLARMCPEIELNMIGGPMGGFEDLWEQITRGAAAIPTLRFLGQVSYHDVNDYYERARVFVNTSDSEGFPNSYLQAWVRGTPVVAFFDPDGVIEREGLGTRVANMAEMRAAVLQFATDPIAWAAASKRCLAYMQRHFAEERILAPYAHAVCG